MLDIKKCLMASMLIVSASYAKADCLWIIGDATPYKWDTDKATALLSKPESSVFSGTLYLEADQDFKFMTVPDWGNEEYGAAPDATLVDGEVDLAKGTNDTGYGKLQVAEAGNYYIEVDTEAMTAHITKSAYQDTQITMCSLFMVGDATPENWDVMKGYPLYQDVEKPYEFTAGDAPLKAGPFKIAIALKGACSWNPEYWYFRDENDANKIARNQEGDLQWTIEKEGKYAVKVNVVDNTISITPSVLASVSPIIEVNECETEYYTMTGVKVSNPSAGIYICKKGTESRKVVIR